MHVAENYWFNWFFGLWMFRHRFHVGAMQRVLELNVKNPAFAKQKNSSNAKGFLWRTNDTTETITNAWFSMKNYTKDLTSLTTPLMILWYWTVVLTISGFYSAWLKLDQAPQHFFLQISVVAKSYYFCNKWMLPLKPQFTTNVMEGRFFYQAYRVRFCFILKHTPSQSINTSEFTVVYRA